MEVILGLQADPESSGLSDRSAEVGTEAWRANLHTEEKMGTGL